MSWLGGYLALLTGCFAVLLRDAAPVLRATAWRVPSGGAWCALLAYIGGVAALGRALPGKTIRGAPLPSQTAVKPETLLYKCNGLQIMGVVVTALCAGAWNGVVDPAWVADHYVELFVAANVLAVGLSVYLFVCGRLARPRNWLAERGVYEDFVMGAELNPFVCGVNVKFFSYRPSMMGWLLINLSFLSKQYALTGGVTGRMLLYQVLTAWYIWDYFVHEPKMVHTYDIIAEHFGLMLIWGDYVFIPFGFSVQNFFLLSDARPLSLAELAGIVCVFCAGFAIFRGANSQKHRFKTEPGVLIWGKPPVLVGGRLLASGFWGIGRHLNYTGDLLLALAYCLPCGFRAGSLPYFYFIYLLLLTLHRERRDDARCAAKYKEVWDEYCLRVPYRMLPFVY